MAEANVRLRVDGRDAVNQLNRVNKAAGTLQGTVGKLVGAFAGIQAAKFVFFKTAELETQTRSLKVLTGSLGNAQKIIKELQQFGAVTPFTSAELIETAKRLKAFGFETEKIVDVTKRLGDIAGATGADLGGIATAFGQIQAKGRLQGEELLQLQERGVDLQGTLRKEYGLTAEQFQKALSKGQIGADAVNFALEKLTNTGGKYAEGAFAQSDTLSGKLSTLQDNIDNLARTLGNVLSPAIKGILDQAIGSLNALNQLLAVGARAQDFGMTQEQRVKILRQAEKEAEELALIRGGGKLDPAVFNQIKMQREKDLVEAYGFKTGQIQPELVAPEIERIRPELGGGTSGSTGGGATGQDLAALAQQQIQSLKDQASLAAALNEEEARRVQFNIDLREIAGNAKGFAEEDVHAQIAARIELEEKVNAAIAYNQALEDTAKIEEKARKDRKKAEEDARKERENDPLVQMQQQFEELIKLENQVAAGATSIGTAFSNAFGAVVTGAKTGQEALADMLKSIASDFLAMAQKIIAQQLAMILYGTIMKALGVSMPGGGGSMGGGNYFDPKTGLGVAGPNFGLAEGGYVNKPTNALIGEGGEPEYVIPESKMRESMSRYSRGSRGNSVIPTSSGGAEDSGGGTAVAAPIDVRYTVERINSVDYVTADQFQSGMRQAASQGAKQGEQQTLKRLQMSGGTRKRLGL